MSSLQPGGSQSSFSIWIKVYRVYSLVLVVPGDEEGLGLHGGSGMALGASVPCSKLPKLGR
jgi:hypothetical protein